MVLEIAQIGDPVLRDIAPEVPVELITSEGIQSFIDDLIETKRHANGAGLAATQVSVPWRIFVVEIVDNQRFPYKPERFDNYEGCLSIPDLVENSKTFCTWQEFHEHHEEEFREQVERLVTRYGS